MVFSKLRIRTRLAIVVLVPVIALVALAALGYRTLYSSRIGSESYDNIVLAKDLVADVNPPAQFVVESYALALRLVDADGGAREPDIARLGELETAYEARHTYWSEVLAPDTQLRTDLVDTSYASARAFFDAIDTALLPAIAADDADTARTVLRDQVTPAYEQHRADITEVLSTANDEVSFREDYADGLVGDRTLQLLVGLAAVGVLIVVVSTLIARSIVRPVRELTDAAQRAEAQLPNVVAAAHEGGPVADSITITPVTVNAKDELSTLAAALNQMQATAVQLATEQAHTRRNVSTMLANLARRNQSLLNRTLSFISQLEENERDPEALENLFKLDHLATRMRRNAESLLVLAGSDPPRTWPRPIEASEIVRAALSEIEAYDRVELSQVETVWVRGSVVSDLTHLLAELLDNATRFSPPNTSVSVVGKLTDKGYLVSVIDQGMGMTAADLAAANADLESIGRLEERSTMVLGLAVVGRLAARSGIHVRLAESPFEGVTAQVRVPFDLLQTPTAEPTNGPHAAAPTGPILRPATPLAGGGPAGAREPVAVAAAAVAAATASVRSAMGADATSELPRRPVPAAGAPMPPPPPGAGAPIAPLTTPPPPPPAGSPMAPPAFAAPQAVPGPGPMAAPPAPAPPVSAPAPAPAVERPAPLTTASGLLQRVPGEHLFEAGPGDLPPPPPVDRSPEAIRDSLSSFQYGYQRRPTTPPRREEDQ